MIFNNLKEFRADKAKVRVHATKRELGSAAASAAEGIIRKAIEEQGEARVIVATGRSQDEVIPALVEGRRVKWDKVHIFHMDEYVSLSAEHPASFRRWIRERLADRVHPGFVGYLDGDAPHTEQECARYARLLASAPIDLCMVGFGENGHIAFNDPAVANFRDPLLVKRVCLDERCRMQQVNEGHFSNLESVPAEALTITCPAIMRSRHLVCCVPDRRKAETVLLALEGPVSEDCPASIVRTHPQAHIFLDQESASLLQRSGVATASAAEGD